MKRSLVMLMAVAFVAFAARPALAQRPVAGIIACYRCLDIAEMPSATLFGFKLPGGDLDSEPDVLYDERLAGGGQLGGARAPDPVDIQWILAPGWRVPQLGPDLYIAIVLDVGRLGFDAGTMGNADFTAVAQQATCAFGGGVAPLVRDMPGGHAVEWNPVLEENATDLIGGGCTLGADYGSSRGFVIGYNVYRLDASLYSAPTLREFLVDGYIDHADVQRLDFTVPDPDGLSGSDLDPTDNLILRNPDGLPDTQDEVLVYLDGSSGAAASWYRLQPVVRGSQSFFDTGLSGTSGTPADRLDLDGDGSLESVDIGRDGFVEFIDPSGRGLGLTHGGEIASSVQPGLGMPPPGVLGCDGRPATEETNCANGIDDDGDGLADCADWDCLLDPACLAEDCTNGLDDDGNGLVDCLDPDCVLDPACVESNCVNGIDDDGDGLADCFDADCCGTAGCLIPPPEIARVLVAKAAIGSDDVIVSWFPAPPIRPGATYDVLSGCIARRPLPSGPPLPGCLWQDRSIRAATCLANDGAPRWWPDSRVIDADVVGSYYLVREQAPCGVVGSHGTDSLLGLRVPGPADCGR